MNAADRPRTQLPVRSRPRVALVCGNVVPDEDGVADYCLRLAGAFGDEVELVLLTAGSVRLPSDPATVPVIRAGAGWGSAGVAAVAAALARIRPDVVHVQFAPSAYGFSPAIGLLPLLTHGPKNRRRAGRLVTTLHEYGWWAWPRMVPSRAWRFVERPGGLDRETFALAPRSDRLVVTNADHQQVVRDRLGVEPTMIPVGANVLPAFRPPVARPERDGHEHPAGTAPDTRVALRAALGLPADGQVLVFFGFVHPVKGVQYLLEALALLRGEGRPVGLAVVGGFTSLALPAGEADALRRELTGHAAALGVAEAVTFTGHVPAEHASAVLGGSDVAVLPFTTGVTMKSGALISVLAHRLPVVVTPARPPDPALVDGGTVVVAERVRDPDSLARALRRVLDDSRLRARVSAGGAHLVADRTWERIAEAHLAVYRGLLAGQRACDDRQIARPEAEKTWGHDA